MKDSVGAARLATMGMLFCNGLLYATWGVNIPLVMNKFGLSEGLLSLGMAMVALGGITTMAAAGRWIGRVGSGRAGVFSGVLMALAAAPIVLVGDFPGLLALLFTYGMATAANDVAANAQIAHLERLSGRSLIGAVHGSFSAGGLVGAILASAWQGFSMPAWANFSVLAGGAGVAMVVLARYLRNDDASRDLPQVTRMKRSGCVTALEPRARRRLRIFGVLALAALVIEGAFYDWAGVYMKEIVKAPASWIGAGYAAFAIGMTLGRMQGDRLRDTYPHQFVMGGSAVVSVCGLAAVLGNASPVMVAGGFLVTGLGLSNVIPVLFSAAGKLASDAGCAPSQSLAVTTRIAYVGLLAGPLSLAPWQRVPACSSPC